MKFRTIFVASALFLATSAQANVMVTLPGNGDVCSNLAGTWAGGGKVTAGIIQCHYHGTATVVKTGDNNYSVDVELKKDDGICPENESMQLPGTCSNGVVVLQTPDANLQGSMGSTGTTMDLTGDVMFTVFGSRVKADVTDMHLQKQ
ncbi:MAG: hypothetical protein P4M12_07895 [Gammaproteobacteria bacterium]|nr:hypothetical protein [Gammaproteobacteria bacterium]